MKTITDFTTEGNISKLNSGYVPLCDSELKIFSDLLLQTKTGLDEAATCLKNSSGSASLNFSNWLNQLIPDDVRFDYGAIALIQLIVNLSKGHIHLIEDYENTLFSYGIFINKVILEKHGGKLIKHINTGDIDVIVNSTIISPSKAIVCSLLNRSMNDESITRLIKQMNNLK